MDAIFKHVWIVFIVFTVINALILKYRSKQYIIEKPERAKGYDQVFKNTLLYGSIPWLIIGLGNIFGSTDGMLDYLRPRMMNPFVLAFYGSIVFLWLLSVRWIYFKNGAEFIEAHPGIVQRTSFSGNKNVTAKQVKIFFPIMLLGGIIGMVMVWMAEIPDLPF